MDKLTVRQFITKFDNGDFDVDSLKAQMDAGWYDWFCKDSALKNKTKTLGKKIKDVSKLNFFDIDKTYVYMKNNCPMDGKTYDSFGICDIETGNQIVWIAPKLGYNDKKYKGKTEVFMNDNSKYFDSWKEAKVFLSELTNKVK